ncbi:MAG: hypothetical protein E7584_04715 [Ruminococcaceae bacterium]|nr:hypothetical protein [Oscillospiraceae bacterium]
MTNNKSTKRALVSSVMALFLCFAMLLGTTYAWFTDVAVSENNKITAGTLDVDLYQWTDTTTKTEITESAEPVFDANIKWEPGYTNVVYLSIKNNGSLALKYRVAVKVTDVSTHNLADVMEYVLTSGAEYGEVTSWAGNGDKFENAPGMNEITAEDIELLPGEEDFFALSIHMLEEAENKYMGETIAFDIRVIAGQATVESNSFGDDTYDAFANYPGKGFGSPLAAGESAREIQITNDEGYKVGSVVIPAAAASGEPFKATIEDSPYIPTITVATGIETTTFDVKVEGLKADNEEPVKVQLRLPAGLDPNTVAVYHYDTEIDSSYNPHTGYVTFESATFSPFTIAYDAESDYEAPEIPENYTTPVATVTYESQYVNVDLPWESYGSWSPTEGLDSQLEAAFTFKCPNYDEATAEYKEIIDAYRYWYCDFYVSLDKELGENQIFLGGNYGSFGWVGFHNGDITLAANEEIPLLGSVTSNPWTYEDVENNVDTFICGVGDVDNALEGAKFTVKLRLTNPENEAEFYDVNVVTYTFGGDYNIQ